VETVFVELERVGAIAQLTVPNQKRFPVQKIVNVVRICVNRVLKDVLNIGSVVMKENVPFQIQSMLTDHVIRITMIPITQTINVLIVVGMAFVTHLKSVFGAQKIVIVKTQIAIMFVVGKITVQRYQIVSVQVPAQRVSMLENPVLLQVEMKRNAAPGDSVVWIKKMLMVMLRGMYAIIVQTMIMMTMVVIRHFPSIIVMEKTTAQMTIIHFKKIPTHQVVTA
jgi:hypothetical protein